jgi:hypothetical protein
VLFKQSIFDSILISIRPAFVKKSILPLESKDGVIVFPEFNVTAEDSFVQKINSSGKK